MSVYLSSDLHGDYDNFQKLLKKINFDENSDKMYILGDVLDRGKDSIKLLKYIKNFMDKGVMNLIKGNHELFAQMFLEGYLKAKQWSAWGGESTINEIRALSADERAGILEFLRNLEHFVEIKLWDKDCVLTHTGIQSEFIVENDDKIDVIASIENSLKNDEFEFLISPDLHYLPKKTLKKLDKFLIVGHTPVLKLNENSSYRVLKKDYYIDIDTGAGHRQKGGKMCAFRVDDKKEFYV